MADLTSRAIMTAVASVARTTVAELRGRRRSRGISRARAVAFYLTRELTDLSFPEIGRAFGGFDHTSVIAACRRVSRDGNLLAVALALREKLRPAPSPGP